MENGCLRKIYRDFYEKSFDTAIFFLIQYFVSKYFVKGWILSLP